MIKTGSAKHVKTGKLESISQVSIVPGLDQTLGNRPHLTIRANRSELC